MEGAAVISALSPAFAERCRDNVKVAFPDLTEGELCDLTYRFFERYVSSLVVENGQVTNHSIVEVIRGFSSTLDIKKKQYDILELVLCLSQKEYGFAFPNLPQFVSISQDKPVITPSGFIAASGGKTLCKLMQDEAARPTKLNDIHSVAGRLIVSLMLYDGVAKKKTLESMLASSRRGWWQIEDELYFFDGTVQVFPCKVTRLWLDQYWLLQRSSPRRISVNRSISAFCAQLNLGSEVSGFLQLRQIARVALVQNVGPAVQSMAFGTLKYTPLPGHVLQRLIVGLPHCPKDQIKHLPSSMTQRSLRRWKNQKKGGYQDYEISIEEQLKHFKNAVSDPLLAVKRERSKDVANKIRGWLNKDEHQSKMPWLWLVVSWALDLLVNGHVKKKIKANTVRKYVNAIAKPFLSEFCNSEPQKINDSLWCTKLNKVIEQTSNGHSKQFVHYFAKYLSGSGEFSPQVLDGLMASSVNVRVDANLVVPKDASYILDHLRKLHGEVYDVARLILCMGIYGGLRRGEVGGLKVRDIDCFERDIVLCIRGNELRGLKSASSRRYLYIHHLWPSSELELLRRRLDKLVKRKEELLFPEQEVLAAAFDLVTTLLGEVTGDNSLRFHHLRHGFANLIWFCLHRHSVKQLPDWLECSYQAFSTISSAERIQKMLGVSPYSRKRLMVLSQLMGHQSYTTTIGSYIHIQPLLMPLLQYQKPNERAYKAILGSVPSCTNADKRDCWEDLLLCPEPDTVRASMGRLSQIEKTVEESPLKMVSILQILRRLSEQEACAKIANDLSLSFKTVTSIKALASRLESTRVGTSKTKIKILAMKKMDRVKADLLDRLVDAFDRKIERDISFGYAESSAALVRSTTPSKDWQIRTDDIDNLQSFLRLLAVLGISKSNFRVKWFPPRLSGRNGQKRTKHLLALRDEVYETLCDVEPENFEIRFLEEQKQDIEILNQGRVSSEGRYLSESRTGIFALSVVRVKMLKDGEIHWFENPRRSEVIPAFVQLIHLWCEARFENNKSFH